MNMTKVISIIGLDGAILKDKYAFGITSLTEDKCHIFMSDIDENISFENAIKICYDILKTYRFGSMFLIESTNGYNILSLDKISLKLIYQINKKYPSVDQLYNDLQYNKRGFYTLRIDQDKKIVWEYLSPNGCFVRSNAHRVFLNNQFNIYIAHNGITDNFDMLKIIKFKNKKHGVLL